MGDFGGIAALGSVEKDTAKQPNDKDTLADVSPTSFLKGSDIMSADKPSMECMAYILGQAMSSLYLVQSHLINDNAKDALKAASEAIRNLNPQVEKHVYNKPDDKEIQHDAPQC